MLAVVEDEQRPDLADRADHHVARRCIRPFRKVQRARDLLRHEIGVADRCKVDPPDTAELSGDA
jgi:hypothetical protein